MQVVKGDAVIVGGGLEGTLLARQLHRQGLKVILLERGRPGDPESAYDPWVYSPFLVADWLWPWILDSQNFWEDLGAWGWRDGVALAQRESVSWLRLMQSREIHGLATETFQPGHFPELKSDPGMGSLYMPRLPVLSLAGLTRKLWLELQREAVDPYADCPVAQIDWEHEWPTAVTRDTIFRGRRLFLMAGRGTPRLLGQPTPRLTQRHLWFECQPLLEDRGPWRRPVVWVHYAKAPLYLCPGSDSWGWSRLWETPEEGPERLFLQGMAERWLSCPITQPAFYDLRVDSLADGLPVLDYHPWRNDCIWMAGVGQTHWAWLPQVLDRLVDPQAQIPEEFSLRRFSGGPIPAHSNG